jgi:glycosyltransferase involved in cell wall biosynthesis
MKSVYLMPVYNQVEEFPRVLDELKAAPLACDTLLIVNNGCTDGSEKLIHSSGYDYIDIPKNLGVGYSYMVALDWALERGYELFGTIASNGKMLPSEMARVMEPVLTGRADYVTGSRFLPGGAFPNLPRFRRGSIPMVNAFVQLLTDRKLSDATCGYRAFRLSIMKHAQFDWHKPWLYTYGFEYYLYAKVLLDPRIRSVEVPVTMRYPEAGKRYSKIKPFKGWYEMLKPFVVARFDGTGFADSGSV